MRIDKKQEEQIVNFGVFGYSQRKIASILGVTESEVSKELGNQESEMSQLFMKGRDMADYVIDLKLFEMAKAGDMNALEKLEERKFSRGE